MNAVEGAKRTAIAEEKIPLMYSQARVSLPDKQVHQLRIEGGDANLRMNGDGQLFLTKSGGAERQLPFEPPTTGYKGDSVFATQQHLLDSLRSGKPAESEGREYLKTVELVEQCYLLSPKPAADFHKK